jgi:hypothetical protein
MRARHRHFNPRAAGAATALDSRFIAGLANTDPISTWSSRTGSNDVTQGTSANRPQYIASGRSSQAVVRFDGANANNQDWLQNTSFVVAQPFFVICATIVNTKSAAVICDATSNSSRVVLGLNASGLAADNGKFLIFSGTNALSDTVDSRGAWNIYCGLFNGSSSKVFRNGAEVASGNAGTNNFATLKIGERFANVTNITQHDGDIGYFAVLASSNQSLRKRLEHASAYSFKIACN